MAIRAQKDLDLSILLMDKNQVFTTNSTDINQIDTIQTTIKVTKKAFQIQSLKKSKKKDHFRFSLIYNTT